MKERYDNLDGLRAISCICIIAMHIQANANYMLHPIFKRIIASWTQFVPLFLMISGFGMFCGYYAKTKEGSLDFNEFYTKRYKKFLPFFISLIILDIVVERSITHIIEGITEATLVFGLLPNNEMEVIGVCWTLGVIFLFYMLFPFVVYLCWTKKRAWISLGVSVIISLFCSVYFFSDKFVFESFAARHNILYCSPWLLCGGIIYLNKDAVKKFISKFRWICFGGCIAITIAWYLFPDGYRGIDYTVLRNLILFSFWLMYSISVNSKILSNRVMRYLGGISMELYLAQMVVFRIVEKADCLYLLGNGWISFIIAWILVLFGLIIFIKIWKKVWETVGDKFFIFKKA